MRLGVLIVALTLPLAAPAPAVPDRADVRRPKPILDGRGVPEPVLVDAKGRLSWTDPSAAELRVIDRPRAAGALRARAS